MPYNYEHQTHDPTAGGGAFRVLVRPIRSIPDNAAILELTKLQTSWG